VFRLVYPGEARQSSTVAMFEGSFRPLRFRGDDGSGNRSKAVELEFDWAAGRVTGVAEGRRVDLGLRPEVHDALSSQVALMAALAAGRVPAGFTLVDKDELKEYAYTAEGASRIDTALGGLETFVYTSRRPGSDRATRVWYARDLGFVPVRAERLRRGSVELTMRITKLQR
jgi:hypothetical protein